MSEHNIKVNALARAQRQRQRGQHQSQRSPHSEREHNIEVNAMVTTERAQHQSQHFGQSKASKAACKKHEQYTTPVASTKVKQHT
jgi:hypothetical protein